MKDSYIISIIGTQEIAGEKDKIEVLTTGEYEQLDGRKLIRYTEYASNDPSQKTDTEVIIEDGALVTIDRKGELSSRLILQKGVFFVRRFRQP